MIIWNWPRCLLGTIRQIARQSESVSGTDSNDR